MMWVDRPNCSAGHVAAPMDEHVWRDPEPPKTERAWVPFRTCSFCGSMHPEDLLTVLRESEAKCLSMAEHMAILRAGPIESSQSRMPAITLEWADRKYGHPHKLYVRRNDGSGAGGKFYVTHLVELGDEAFTAVATALAEKTRILFSRDLVGTKWQEIVDEGGGLRS